MQKIGFANVMYTLWTVEKGSKYTTYRYVRTISKDIDKVKHLYPDVEIDMTLKGHHSFVVSEDKIPFQPNTFMCGKYKGEPIYDENRGEDREFAVYVAWLFGDMYKGDINEEFVIKTLEQNHYHVEEYDFHFV